MDGWWIARCDGVANGVDMGFAIRGQFVANRKR